MHLDQNNGGRVLENPTSRQGTWYKKLKNKQKNNSGMNGHCNAFKYSKEKLANVTYQGKFDRQMIKVFLFLNEDGDFAQPPPAGGRTNIPH